MSLEPSRADSTSSSHDGGANLSLALRISNRATDLVLAREQVRAQLLAWAVDEKALYAVELILEELAGNTLRYGYDAGADGTLSVEVALGPATVRVALTDDGRPFDPTRVSEPYRPRTIADVPIGGRGISMVRRVSSAMRYRREDGRNRLEVDVPRAPLPNSGCD